MTRVRPSETPAPDGLETLADADVPAFLEGARVCLLAFLDKDDAAFRARLDVLAASLARPGFRAGAVDLDRHRLVADAMGVQRAPCVVVFVDGEAVDRLLGAPPDAVLRDVVEQRVRASG